MNSSRQHRHTVENVFGQALSANQQGITLVEVAISTLLVGLVMVASLQSMGGVVRTWQTGRERSRAVDLAHVLMAEIMQRPYLDPEDSSENMGPNTGESTGNRLYFDDVDDYHGWSQSPPQDRDGSALSEFSGWSRSVQIDRLSPHDPNSLLGLSSTDKGVKKICVAITDQNGEVLAELHSIRSAPGGVEQPPALDSTIITAIDCQLQVGTVPAVRASMPLTNHTEDR